MLAVLSLGLALITPSSQGDPLDRSITLEIEAAAASKVFESLSVSAGVRLRADRSTQDDVLTLRVANVHLRDLMARIARLDCAAWRAAEDGSYELVRTSERLRIQEREDRRAVTESIRKQIEAYAKALPKLGGVSGDDARSILEKLRTMDEEAARTSTGSPGGSEWTERLQSLTRSLPLHRLLQRLVVRLGPAVWADLPRSDEHPFAAPANEVQIALPIAWAREAAAFKLENDAFLDASGVQVDSHGVERPVDHHLGGVVFRDPPVKVILRLARRSMGLLSVYGRFITADGSADAANESIMPLDLPARLEARESAQLMDVLPERSRKFLAALGGRSNPERLSDALDQEVKGWVRDPIAHEPLAFVPGSLLLAVARERKANLVAVLSDQTRWLLLRFSSPRVVTVLDAERILRSPGSGLRWETDGPWIEFKPDVPTQGWADRLDRALLKQLVQVASGPTPALGTTARLALALPPTFVDGLVWSIVPFTSSGPRLWSDLRTGFHRLRFYGSLGLSQKLALSQGRSIRLGELSPMQVAALQKAIYYGGAKLEPNPPPGDPAWRQPIGFAFNEATEILPHGLSADGTLSMSRSEEQRVIPVVAGRAEEPASAQMVAALLLQQEHATETPIVRSAPSSYRLAWQQKITLRVDFAEGVTAKLEYVESESDPTGRDLTFQQLPDAFRQAVLDWLNRMRKSVEGG